MFQIYMYLIKKDINRKLNGAISKMLEIYNVDSFGEIKGGKHELRYI